MTELRDSGQRIAHFELEELIGRGGMGEVWLAHDVMLHRDVAVKVLSEECQLGPDAEARLVREARAASALDHPGIVRVYQLGHEAAHLFIVMEYVEGETLVELVENGPLDPSHAVDLVDQVAAALGAAHDAGLVHRDIKPDNVVVRKDGRAKVLDFGLVHAARSLGDSIYPPPMADRPSNVEVVVDGSGRNLPPEANDTMLVLGCTKAAAGVDTAVAGTPLYMAPEQVRGEATAASDQFALAATAFELFTGRPLRRGRTIDEVLHCDVSEALRRAEGALPPRVGKVLARALAEDPEERFPDIRAFSNALSRSVRPMSLPPSTRRRLRRHRWLIPALLAAVSVIVGGWLFATRVSQATAPIQIAIIPGNKVLFTQLYAPLGDYINQRIDADVRMTVTRTYGAAVDGLIEGRYQLAFLAPAAYVDAKQRMPSLVLLGCRSYREEVSYQAVIVGRRDEVSELGDLRDKTICFVDEQSTSGYLVPRQMLMRAGIDPRKDLDGAVLSGDHFRALRDLSSGECVAATVSTMELADAPRQGLPTDDFVVLARSGELPPVPLVAREDVPSSLRQGIREAMQSAGSAGVYDHEKDLSEQVGDFIHCEDADFDLVRDLD